MCIIFEKLETMTDRIRYILLKLQWEGRISRQDLMTEFQIASTQATKDFKALAANYPGAAKYDLSQRRYVTDKKLPDYLSGTHFNDYIQFNADRTDKITQLSATHHEMEPEIFQPVIQSIQDNKGLKFHYRSLKSPNKKSERHVIPVRIIHSGFRWHFRAYEPASESYKDFRFSRVSGVITEEINTDNDVPIDNKWETIIDIVIQPNPTLANEKQDIIALDFNMTSKKITVQTNAACLIYVLRDYEITDFSERPSHHQLLAIKNNKEVTKHLQRNKT